MNIRKHSDNQTVNISSKPFGHLPDGSPVTCWMLSCGKKIYMEILDYGVTIRSLIVPDKTGEDVDVVLGYDTLEEYILQDGYLGAVIGRFANRISGASFSLNSETYPLFPNEIPHHLHGGKKGFDKYVWDACPYPDGIRFTRISPDGEEGYPGTLRVTVDVHVKEGGLRLNYRAFSDRDTICNLTNHSYFNLNGQGDIYDHLVTIHADYFTPCTASGIPTGETLPVTGTDMDFRIPKTVGEGIHSKEPYVALTGGYDSNYILRQSDINKREPASLRSAAEIYSPKTGICLTVTTDQPGMHFYTANFLQNRRGKDGATYHPRSGLCLETQHYPDSIHHPEWPSCILRAGEILETSTEFSFHLT